MAKHKELLKRTSKPGSERENDTPWYYGHLMEASSESDEDENADRVSNTQKDIRTAAAAAEKRRLKKRIHLHDTVHIPTEDDLAPRADDDMEDTEPAGSQDATDATTRLAACLDSFGKSADGEEPDWQKN